MAVSICAEPFEPLSALKAHEDRLQAGSFGATATFVGTMRDFNEGDDVESMTLEHYPGMTESQLQLIIDDASSQWPLQDVLLVHRVGDIRPGDPIVLVACWSAHRAAAFDACRFLMEALKSRAPFWKRETLTDQSSRWVEKNTAGYSSH
jgi:molybdopterin synthase catalytic subunit